RLLAIGIMIAACASLPAAPRAGGGWARHWAERERAAHMARGLRGGEREEAGERGDDLTYPSDWFFAQRAFPSGPIDQAKYLAAAERASFDRNRLGTSTLGLVWQPAGPYNIGGRVTALAVVPGGSSIYLASANGGVFRSDDSGVNWTSVFDRD